MYSSGTICHYIQWMILNTFSKSMSLNNVVIIDIQATIDIPLPPQQHIFVA